jgi:predicted Zn-dependent protease
MPMIAVMLGHALIASENSKNFAEAKQVLKTAVNRDNDNPFAWYQLGIVYDQEGDQPRAAPGDGRAQQPGRQQQDSTRQRADGDGRPAAGNPGLSSRAGYRHGLRNRAEEGQGKA